MKKATILIIASLSSVIGVSIISTCWILFPYFIIHAASGNLVNQALFFMFWSASVSCIIVLVIGIPVYLVLEKKGKASQKNLALVGFIIPVIILLAINFPTFHDGNSTFSSGQNYYGTYRKMIVDNKRTFWGWVSLTEQLFTFGIYGLIGATIFGKIALILKKPTVIPK